MKTSESIVNIAPALVKAQAEIKSAVKDSTNPHFRSKYADLGSVVDAVKPALLKHGMAFLQGVHDAVDGVAVETMLLHTSGEWISSTMRIPAVKQDAQGYGSAITYGRRYGLQSMCGVPAEDDDGDAAAASTSSRITPVAGSLAALEPKDQEKAKEIAADIVEQWTKGNEIGAYELFYEANHDNEMKLGIWECMTANSKVRNGIKKIADENRKKVANA
jgi:hypothetical protein